MIKSLSKLAFSALLFLLSFSNTNAFCSADSAGVLMWKEMMDSTNFYQEKQDFQTALQWALQAEVKTKAEFGEMDTNYINVIEEISETYYNNGNLDTAIIYAETFQYLCRKTFKIENTKLVESLNWLGFLYMTLGEYSLAKDIISEALEVSRKIFNTDNINLVLTLNNNSWYYCDYGNYSQAESLAIEALNISRRLNNSDNQLLANSILGLGYLYSNMGNFKKAEPLLLESLAMNRRLHKNDNIDLAININCVADLYHWIRSFEHAESLYIEALEMYRRLFKNGHPYLEIGIQCLADFYFNIGKYDKAELLYNEDIEMSRRIYKADNAHLSWSLTHFALFYQAIGKDELAEPFFIEALEISKRISKKENIDLAWSKVQLANFYFTKYELIKAEPLFVEALDGFISYFNTNTISLSNNEIALLWNKIKIKFEIFLTFALERAKKNPMIINTMYDIQLYSKALLLNSANKIKRRVFNSGDSVLINQYQSWSDMKEFLVKLYKMSNVELKKKNFSIDSIENVANDLEKQISLKSEDFKQSYEKKKVTWKLIQGLLKPDEAAVEVVRFRYFDKKRFTDTINYAFLIVTNETEEHPEFVLFEDGNKLENEWYNEYRNLVKIKSKDTVSFGRFWGKLNEKLKDYKKIYLSPDGIYNKLNPSTLMMPDGKFLLDIQDIQQVNSTKDLLLGYYQTKQESNLLNSAVLIGNPNFGLEEDKVKETARKIRGEKQEEKSYEQLANVRGLQLTRLPGTETEIKDIEKFLKTKSWVINSYLGDMAVKTAIKNANSPRILHIATHGLFLEDVKRSSKDLFGFEEQKMVENPLLRSGLFFTGADNYIKKENPGLVEEDNGLLTAYEAMNLNLDKTELVVLSACETGLGEIQNGEGVFGLRRAFQQAGARTVLMSLWKVSDDATQMLMSNFYKNWVSGMTKREAFAKAQQQVRAKYPEPYYWGAFVMVGE
jgi:tetratricopeptide (TPR) repeat protein